MYYLHLTLVLEDWEYKLYNSINCVIDLDGVPSVCLTNKVAWSSKTEVMLIENVYVCFLNISQLIN